MTEIGKAQSILHMSQAFQIADSKPALPAEEKKLSKAVQSELKSKPQSHIKIEYNKNINMIVITMFDGTTNEKVWQFPPEEMIAFAENFQKFISGSVVNISL